MVTRRKYRARANAPADVNVAVVAPQAPPDAPGPAAGGGASPLAAALQAQQHAESLQHQHAIRQQAGLAEPPLDPATQQAIDAHIDRMNLSAHKTRFLKAHPSLLREPYNKLMAHAYQIALHAGIPDDTPAMDAAVLSGITRDLEHHRQLSQLTSAQARPMPQAHQDTAEAVAALQAEAAQHLAEHQPAPLPPRRKSMPMQAPVSRDYPSASGHGRQDRTLSADERQIARVSMPHLPPEQAELEYLRNRQRMHRMKASGEIQGDA